MRLALPLLFIVEGLALRPILMAQWNQMENGLLYNVQEITVHNEDIFVGGNFLDAGGDPDADFAARWDGCHWHSIGPGINGEVWAISIVGNDIYIGGNFTQPFLYVARWDGAQWHPLGNGPGLPVKSIIAEANSVIAGGGTYYNGFVAKWNGTTWSNVGPELNGIVHDIGINGSDLYAGGRFTNAGGNPDADGIIRWDGSAWQNLGIGIDADIFQGVWDLLLYEDELYVGGVFINAGGNQYADGVAKWDGNDWINLGQGPGSNSGLHAINILGGALYTTSGIGWWPGDDAIYRWDFVTETWSVFQYVGLGPDDPMTTLANDDSNLYVGSYSGMEMDGNSYASIARWGEPVGTIVTSTADSGGGSLRKIIACASNDDIISFELTLPAQITLTSGEIIINKNLTIEGSGYNDLTLSGNNNSRIFHLLPTKDLVLENLSLKNASALSNGGAMYIEGKLTLDNVVLQDNFENGIPKGLTLSPGALLTIDGTANIHE